MHVKVSKSKAMMFVFEGESDLVNYVDPKTFRERETGADRGREFSSWEEVMKAAQEAWEDGIEQLGMFTERLREIEIKPIKSHKRVVVWGPGPDGELDLERMQQGETNCYKTYKREKTDGPTSLTVIIDVSTPWHIDSFDILWRGAAAIALTYLLEEKGYSVELWVAHGSTFFANKPYPGILAACLKRTSDPLDMSSLVNTVAGWFYRTVIFTLMRTIGIKTGERICESLGQVYNPTETDLDEITPDALRIYSTGVFTFNGACNLMESELEKLADSGENAT